MSTDASVVQQACFFLVFPQLQRPRVGLVGKHDTCCKMRFRQQLENAWLGLEVLTATHAKKKQVLDLANFSFPVLADRAFCWT